MHTFSNGVWGIYDTQWYTKYQVAFKLNNDYNQLRQYYDYSCYHTLTNSWNLFIIAEFYSWGHYFTLKFQHRVREMRMHWNYNITRVTTLHGAWGITVTQKQHYAMTSCLVAISDSQTFSFITMHSSIDHSDLATRNCLIPRING